MSDRESAKAILRHVGTRPEAAIDIAEAALALASLDRPRVDLKRYRHHLSLLARDVAEVAGKGGVPADCPLDRRVAALNDVIARKYGYAGDRLSYEDMQNANLMRVIDRRKGLPIALSILYLHCARAQGWEAHGLGFPGHFLIRLDRENGRVILDPFSRGRICAPEDLRGLLKATLGLETELEPAHYEPVGNRAILLRLQNNIKLRLIGGERLAPALDVVETMLLFAPDAAELWREAGLLNRRLGHLGRAIECLEAYLRRQPGGAARHAAAAQLQSLRNRLN